MSTDHVLARSTDDSKVIELSVLEHSSLLDILMMRVDDNSNEELSINDLTPDEVMIIACKMLQSASYSSDDPEKYLDQAISKINNNRIGSYPIIKKFILRSD